MHHKLFQTTHTVDNIGKAFSVLSVTHQVLLRNRAEGSQEDADHCHVVVAGCHMQTRISTLEQNILLAICFKDFFSNWCIHLYWKDVMQKNVKLWGAFNHFYRPDYILISNFFCNASFLLLFPLVHITYRYNSCYSTNKVFAMNNNNKKYIRSLTLTSVRSAALGPINIEKTRRVIYVADYNYTFNQPCCYRFIN